MTENQGSRTRAKFAVWNVARNIDSKGDVLSETIAFGAVQATDKNSENQQFWNATPVGQISMTITNQAMFGHFRPGQQWYLDFTEATE